MQAIIEGKRYDTEKATTVAEYTSPHLPDDFHFYEEFLCRTPKGSWFLVGQGHGLSPYGVKGPEGFGYGQKVKALSEDEAFNWLQEHGETEALEHYFGDSIEDA